MVTTHCYRNQYDGKDDIILKATSTTTRTMIQDEFYFQKLSRRQREILQKYLRN